MNVVGVYVCCFPVLHVLTILLVFLPDRRFRIDDPQATKWSLIWGLMVQLNLRLIRELKPDGYSALAIKSSARSSWMSARPAPTAQMFEHKKSLGTPSSGLNLKGDCTNEFNSRLKARRQISSCITETFHEQSIAKQD
jgi:hypothetical protein